MPRVLRRLLLALTVAALAAPGSAAAATVELDSGHGAPPVRAAALAGSYGGAFAGRVRFFLAAVPAPPLRIRVFEPPAPPSAATGSRPTGESAAACTWPGAACRAVHSGRAWPGPRSALPPRPATPSAASRPPARLLGADGYALADVGLAPVALGPARTVARGRGWVATATRIAVPDSTPGIVVPDKTICVQVTRGAPRGLSADCLYDAPGRVRVSATCAPRLVHVFGAGARATLGLLGGRRRAATARHGAWHAVLRGDEALRAVRVAGRTVDLAVPPAAAQCGYSAFR